MGEKVNFIDNNIRKYNDMDIYPKKNYVPIIYLICGDLSLWSYIMRIIFIKMMS